MQRQNLLLGIGESLGLPFQVSEKKQCFHDYILESIYQKKKDSFLPFNLFSMLLNKTWNIEDFLRYDLSLDQLQKIKSYANDEARNTIFTKIGMPKEESTISLDIDFSLPLSHFMKDNRPLILYSGGINDFMSHFNHNFFIACFKRKNTKLVFKKMKYQFYIEEVCTSVKRNLETILMYNPNACIYVLEFSLLLYTPTIPLWIWKHKNSFSVISQFQKEYHDRLKKICDELGVTYIETGCYPSFHKAINEIPEVILSDYEKKGSLKVKNKLSIPEQTISDLILKKRNELRELKDNQYLGKDIYLIEKEANQIKKIQQEQSIYERVYNESKRKKKITLPHGSVR